MLILKSLSFTVPQYLMLLLVILAAGLAVYFYVKNINKTAGKIILIVLMAGFVYGGVCEYPKFDFFGLVQNSVKTKEHLVALTFDDGPSAKYTSRILDELKKNGAHATFFITGKNAEKHPEIIRRIVREGHDLGNHTYSHPFMFKEFSRFRKEEILKTDEIIYKITGMHMIYFRAPYEYRDVRLVELLHKLGYVYISHNESSLDAMGASSGRIVSQIMKQLKPGTIFLLHDARGNREQTVNALKILLPRLREKGYRAVTIGELLKAKK